MDSTRHWHPAMRRGKRYDPDDPGLDLMHPREGTPREVLASAWGVSPCSHWRVPFALDENATVYLSSWAARCRSTAREVKPTAAVYLDDAWIEDRSLLSNATLPPGTHRGPEVRYVDWPALGVVDVDLLDAAVVWALRHLRTGAVVEVGCYWGHGRTGTTAAAMLVYQGWGPQEAIEEVREAYCRWAIETEDQEELIRRYARRVKSGRDSP